jgi:sodium/myo-inositol cotransporter 3
LYSGALFIKIALGWDLYYAVLLVLAMTSFCTIVGGLTAVIYTDFVQALIMVGGGLTLMAISFAKIGSYKDFYVAYMESVPNYVRNASLHNVTSPYLKCGIPNPNAFQMLRGINDPDMPWLGFLLGQTPASIWYWCSDQVRVFFFD